MNNDNILSQQTIYHSEKEKYEHLKRIEEMKERSLYISKNVAGWDLTVDITAYGKISATASKYVRGNTLKLSLETPDKAVPAFSKIGYELETKWIELDNDLDTVTQSLKSQAEDYTRKLRTTSSIVTVEELLKQTAVSSFEDLLKQKTLDEICSKAKTKVSKRDAAE